jgi:hypothetical protein
MFSIKATTLQFERSNVRQPSYSTAESRTGYMSSISCIPSTTRFHDICTIWCYVSFKTATDLWLSV